MQIATIYVITCVLGIVSLGTARNSRQKKYFSPRNGQGFNNDRGRPENRRTAGPREWSYATVTGPEKWVKEYPECGGSYQSPVNIDLKRTVRENFMPIKFSGYDKSMPNIEEQNNGHTVVFRMEAGRAPTISGAALPVAYNFTQLHFHWGKQDSYGSEHTINGKRYPMELHFVHENEDRAAAGRTGIAVLAAFLEISKEDNPHLEIIVKALKRVRSSDKEAALGDSLKLYSLIPEKPKHFFRYIGSLTTPPCTEGVIWTIFKEPLYISRKQIQAFRDLDELPESNHHKLFDNFRPTQKLNGRKILESKPSYYK